MSISKELEKLVQERTRKVLEERGHIKKQQPKTVQEQKQKQQKKQQIRAAAKKMIKEAVVILPKSFLLKTEKLSQKTKSAHEVLYNKYIKAFNQTSSALDSANKEAADANRSDYRSLKLDECYNLNAIKFHELYFHNISDVSSEIGLDSVPYMRLAENFGSFETWQFDFIASCMSAREGWGVVVYEPFKKVYMNVIVDGHTNGIPLNCVPVLVFDMWAHAYYKDYVENKRNYVTAMMKEINWDIVEARMVIAERSELHNLYQIQPVVNDAPEKMLSAAEEADRQAPVPVQNPEDEQNPQVNQPQQNVQQQGQQ